MRVVPTADTRRKSTREAINGRGATLNRATLFVGAVTRGLAVTVADEVSATTRTIGEVRANDRPYRGRIVAQTKGRKHAIAATPPAP